MKGESRKVEKGRGCGASGCGGGSLPAPRAASRRRQPCAAHLRASRLAESQLSWVESWARGGGRTLLSYHAVVTT